MTSTLEYETPRFLQSLFNGDLSLLKEMENRLRLKITTRDGWLKLDGGEPEVESGRRVFAQLEKARRGGAEINGHFFRLALDTALREGADPDNDNGGPPPVALDDLMSVRLLGSPRKPPVIARSRTQIAYVQAIRERDVVFGIGPAGTGKTYLAMACAIDAWKSGDVQRIVLTRPAVEAGEALGFLPGDMNEKILPYLRPLYDALYDMLEPDEVERMIDRGVIEIAPLAFMRGRTLSRSFVVLDEAQNTTRAQMFMFLTRLGENSRCVITGDPSQVDLKDPGWSGLREAIAVLRRVDGLRFVEFSGSDVVRHPLVRKIIEAYDAHRADEEMSRPASRS